MVAVSLNGIRVDANLCDLQNIGCLDDRGTCGVAESREETSWCGAILVGARGGFGVNREIAEDCGLVSLARLRPIRGRRTRIKYVIGLTGLAETFRHSWYQRKKSMVWLIEEIGVVEEMIRRKVPSAPVPPVAVPPRDGETVPVAPVPPRVEVPFAAPVPPPVLIAEEPVTQVEKFLRLQPPTYSGGPNPDTAEHWVHEIERVFATMRCPTADRVVLAAYQLRGFALEWWRLKMQTTFAGRAEEAITWSEFLDDAIVPLMCKTVEEAAQRAATLERSIRTRQKFEMADRRDWGGGGDDPEESTQRMIERIWESLTDIQRRMDQQAPVPPVVVPPGDGETVPIALVLPGVEVPFAAPVPPPPPVLLAEEPVMQVEKIMRLQPPTYLGGPNPDTTEHWVHEIERVFATMRCPAADKVVLAAYQLRGFALEWWRLKMQTTFSGRTEEAITWSEFLDWKKQLKGQLRWRGLFGLVRWASQAQVVFGYHSSQWVRVRVKHQQDLLHQALVNGARN
ncbi:hypothetical protein Taro_001866 [Colocasia esculenta]|uniref:Retrotransposon gag domain-containing protein n=1 Tax=Colocasia esculenta TaxID=4460 RepID=A0A843TCG0_COLES|nr:hypothetical protein [Colocasia esculenta]